MNTNNWKAWTALAGSLANALAWVVNNLGPVLPPQWMAVISGLIAVLTALGVYRVPPGPGLTTPDTRALP